MQVMRQIALAIEHSQNSTVLSHKKTLTGRDVTTFRKRFLLPRIPPEKELTTFFLSLFRKRLTRQKWGPREIVVEDRAVPSRVSLTLIPAQ